MSSLLTTYLTHTSNKHKIFQNNLQHGQKSEEEEIPEYSSNHRTEDSQQNVEEITSSHYSFSGRHSMNTGCF